MRATVGEMLAALEAVRPGAASLVQRKPDPAVAAIVGGWPAAFVPDRGLRLGFSPHEDLRSVVEAFIADDLEATRQSGFRCDPLHAAFMKWPQFLVTPCVSGLKGSAYGSKTESYSPP